MARTRGPNPRSSTGRKAGSEGRSTDPAARSAATTIAIAPPPPGSSRRDGIIIGRALAAASVAAVALLVAAATAWGSVSAQQLARAETVISGLRSAGPSVSSQPGPTPSFAPAPSGTAEADIQARIDAAVAAERSRVATACVTPMTAAAIAQDALLKKYDQAAAVYRPGSTWDANAALQLSKLDQAYRSMRSAANAYKAELDLYPSLAFDGKVSTTSYNNGTAAYSTSSSAGVRARNAEATISSTEWKALNLKAQATQLATAKAACQAALTSLPGASPSAPPSAAP